MHQCMQCNRKFSDEDRSILTGCVCGSKLFLYVKHNVNVFRETGKTWQVETKTNGHRALPVKQEPEAVEAPKQVKVEHTVKKRKIKRDNSEVVRVRDGVYRVNLDALMQKRA